MDLERYFLFLSDDDIRIRGTRIGIEHVLYEYIHRGQTAEAIAARFHTLSLDQVYATILYYLENRERIDAYVADWLAYTHAARAAQEQSPPPAVVRLRERIAERAVER